MNIGERNGAILKEVLKRNPIRPGYNGVQHISHLMSELFPFTHALAGPRMTSRVDQLGINRYHYVYDNGAGLGIDPPRRAILFLGSLDDLIITKLAWSGSYEVPI